ncbi:NACHT domain-containing protein [Streptomyces sp. cg36]|uniref:NACHT domain-containing protein n=1 Tax=Streptomyces sp. cg36 TaxID=3238798 RepID=UPI0034E199C9
MPHHAPAVPAATGTGRGARVVAVLGPRQGTGVLIGPGLVLTCAHLLDLDALPIVLTEPTRTVTAQVAWCDRELDVALLACVDEAAQWPGGVLRLGRLGTEQPLPGCEVTGFPDVQRLRGRELDRDHFTGTVLPLAGLRSEEMTFEFDRPPAAERADGTSPLAGLSGAPVFAGETLIGIAREVQGGRAHYRVRCVPVSVIVDRPDFASHARWNGVWPRVTLEAVTGAHSEDARYEGEYAGALRAEYRRTRIFGLDELGRNDSEWDLDTAYLSLEAEAKGPGGPGLPYGGGTPQRIDALLASRPCVLLRGDAGAGKTTLVWWLAAHAAAGTLGPGLAELNGLVPFVVPLRTLRATATRYPVPGELPHSARLMIDGPPEGWAVRVLAAGRALLLVDGLDEVPPDDREEAHRWLSHLLERYPGNRCVATVRPLAVEPDWLKRSGFAELRLLPMRDDDIQAFVTAWHAAARLDSDPREPLDDLERDLAHQFRTNPTLADLARTPLLCAVICALHRLRQGFLPKTRWDLYQSALRMLLGERDERRKVGAPERIALTVEESTQLLQRIAVWLVREGQSLFTDLEAAQRIERALPGMAGARDRGTPADVLRYLLNRSGLLQERDEGVYQFAHRTFQDFLAAKELVEDDHLKELVRHATEDTWQDVILLAAGHCGRQQLAGLVNGLLKLRGRGRGDTPVLAALCAQHAAWLDERTLERVREGVVRLLPPVSGDGLRTLARLGPSLLPLLPDPATVTSADRGIARYAELISAIGGAEAVPHAYAWGSRHPAAAQVLAQSWSQYPAAAYAREVLARIPLAHFTLQVRSKEQLDEVRGLPGLDRLMIWGDFTTGELAGALDGSAPRSLLLRSNTAVSDLSFLRGATNRLERLDLVMCPRLDDFSALSDLTGLTGLTELRLRRVGADDLSAVPAHSGVTRLAIEASTGPVGTVGLEAWRSLSYLSVSRPANPTALLRQVDELPKLNQLELWIGSARDFHGAPACPAVRDLTLHLAEDRHGIERLPGLFPSLKRLHLLLNADFRVPGPRELKDLKALFPPTVGVIVNGSLL